MPNFIEVRKIEEPCIQVRFLATQTRVSNLYTEVQLTLDQARELFNEIGEALQRDPEFTS